MEVGKIIVGEPLRSTRETKIDPRPAWRALAGFGLLFVGAALVDLALAFYSADMTQPVPRFAAFAGATGSLPLLTIGALGSLMASLAAGTRRLTLAASVVTFLLAIGVLILAVRFFLATAPAFAAAPPAGHAALKQAMIRGWVFYSTFGLALVVSATIAWRSARGTGET